nr:YadA-like family protein [Burkholderia multivorans]
MGSSSVSTRGNEVSVGSDTLKRQITNVAAGTQDTDAVNLAQLNAALENIGSDSPYFRANGAGDGSDSASAVGVGSVAIGSNASTVTDGGVAIGVNAKSTMANGVAIGNTAVASENAVAIGRGADAQSAGSIAFGAQSSAASNGTSLGFNAKSATNAIALGANTVAVGNNSIALGNGSQAVEANTVSVGSAGNERKIVNVAQGAVNAASTDAVNGAQLFDTTQSVADALGGGAKVNPDGTIDAPAYQIGGTDFNNVGDALTNLDGRTTANTDDIADLRDKLTDSGLVDGNGNTLAAVTYDKNADGTPNYGSVSLGGEGATAPVALKNVAAGKDDTDAVNVGQLKSSGLIGDDEHGNLTSLAVTYDDATKSGITLGNAGAPVAIHNVAAGDLSATSTDAVNGSQLFATNTRVGSLENSLQNGGVIDPVTGQSLAVVYDSAAKNRVTLGGAGAANPVVLSNVAQGVAGTDAVNVDQLNAAVEAGSTANPYIGGRGTGVAARATGINAVALGLGSLANEVNTISVGNSTTGLQRRITNVQDGQADSDAATVGQVNSLVGVASTSTQAALNDIDLKTTSAIQDVNNRLDAIGTMAGTDPYVQVDGAGDGSDNAFVGAGSYGVAVGAEASATGSTSIAIGAQSMSSGSGSVALGAGATAAAAGAVAFGSGRAAGVNALALGNGTNATGNNAVAAGFNAGAAGVNALALGNTARANAGDSLAFGTTAQVDPLATNGIAIGRAASVTSAAQNSVALGSNSVADRLNSISVGSSGQQRQIIYVSRGTADTDAVNVSQLKDAVSAFGGNAAVGADGSIVNPTYTVGGTTYHNVGDALNALAQQGGGGSGPLAVTYAANADGSPNFELVTLQGGADGTTLTNVAAGAVNATSKDAINGSQLHGTAQSVADSLGGGSTVGTDGRVTNPTYSLVDPAGGSGKIDYDNVGDALANLDGRTTRNTGDIDDLKDQLADSGLVDGNGDTRAVVTYDKNADGTPNYGSVTLGDGNGPVKVSNVADATDDSDAVNLGQLKDSGLVGDDGHGNLTSLAVTYDDAGKTDITLGSTGTPVAIHNVAEGELSATSTDAVNGSQLFATNKDIGDLRDSLENGGVIDPVTGQSLAVVYDSAAKDTVTLGGAGATTPVQLKNVAAGTDDTDAVNVAQLKDAGLVAPIDPTNPGAGLASLAVTYDKNTDGSANFDQITLKGGVDGTKITNVAAGELSATSTDAVNGSQLFATNKDIGDLRDSLENGGAIDPVTGESLAVVYDSASKDKATLAGVNGTTLSNVKAGVADMDAVNVSQLKGSGLIGDDGKSIAAVTYDRHTDGTPNYGSVTLGGGNAAGPVTLSNVAAGTADTDAVNYGQMKQYVDDSVGAPANPLAVAYDDTSKDSVTLGGANGTTLTNVAAGAVTATSKDAINGSQLYGTAQSVADSLGGGSTVDTNGNVTNPTYSLADPADASRKQDYHNVGDALANLDGRVVDNTTNITVIRNQLADSGLVDPVTGQSLAAVTYDRNADGTPNYGSVTLGNGSGAVKVTNVADATGDSDAVNLGQLKGSGLVGDDGRGNLTSLAVVYDSVAKDTVTLGGTGATTPVQLKNVAAGTDDTDAVNVAQLKDAGLVAPVDPTNPGAGLASLAVTYDKNADGSANFDQITLKGGVDGTKITNVAAGELSATSTDAVNGSQLFATNTRVGSLEETLNDSGLIDPVTGKSLAVVYDDATRTGVTLGNAGTPVAIHNVAAGTGDTDAVNVGQLKDSGLVGDDGHGNLTSLAVTYDDATKSGVTLGNAGTPVAIHNVAAGDLSATSTDAVNGSQLFATNQDIGDLRDSLQNGGVIDPVTGQSLAVTYDDATKSGVTLGNAGTPVAIHNVAAGTGDTDAVNVGQLKDSGLVGDDGHGNLTSLAVTYDDAGKTDITLGSTGTPVAIHNVAAGELSATSTDAVNGSQLFATNTRVGSLEETLNDSGLIDPVTGKSLAVVYDSAAKDTVTLGGAGATTPVQLKNVAAGTDDTDAVNVAQLKDAGLVAPVDPTNPGAGLASLAVTYDKNADDSANFDRVTLKGGANGTTLTNVAAGAVTATSKDAINGSQLHGTAQSVADSLGGGSTVDANGNVTNPTYSLADPADPSRKQDYRNVGDALANLDGRVVDNTTNITVIQNQLADSGLVDPVTGQSLAAVTYDRNADGTPNYGSVTLGNGNGPVRVSNVADGVARHDAVNLGQLQDAGLVAPVDPGNPGTLSSLAVTYGKNTDGSANFDQVVLAGKGGTTISNVKAGAVNAASTDAVNGAQLHGVAQSVADSLGGGSTVDADGKVTSPTYVVNNQTFNNVGDAITNISNSLADGSIGLVQQDETTRDITVAKDTDGTVVNFASTASDRVLTGVAAGAVNATSHDAINGSQLYGTAQSVADVIGGGTTVDPDGKLADTAIEVNGNKYRTVAEAVQAAAQYGATDSLAVRYDLKDDGTPNYGSVTLGGTGAAPVVLTNVADGVNKYDAVNFGQLSELNDKFNGLDDRVGVLEQNPGNGGGGGGGGSGDNPYFAGTDTGARDENPANAGTGTGNTAAGSGSNIGGGANNGTVIGSGSNVSKDNGTAIGSGASSTGEGATAIGSGASASGNQSVAIGAGSVASDPNTVSFGDGTEAGNRRIVNIADGVNANDAASKGQLDRAVGGLQGQINDVSRNAYSGIAAATALTMIPGVDPGKTLSFGIGGATYKGYQAVAFGGEARITQNLKMKAGVGLSSGGNTVGVGASYQW